MIGRFVRCFPGGMASSAAPPPSIRQGVRIAPPDGSVTVEEVLLAVGEQVGHDKLSYASRMNKAVVVFLKDEPFVHRLIEAGVVIRDLFVQVSPLSVPSTRSLYPVFRRLYRKTSSVGLVNWQAALEQSVWDVRIPN